LLLTIPEVGGVCSGEGQVNPAQAPMHNKTRGIRLYCPWMGASDPVDIVAFESAAQIPFDTSYDWYDNALG
jgi:hypothetical protein